MVPKSGPVVSGGDRRPTLTATVEASLISFPDR